MIDQLMKEELRGKEGGREARGKRHIDQSIHSNHIHSNLLLQINSTGGYRAWCCLGEVVRSSPDDSDE